MKSVNWAILIFISFHSCQLNTQINPVRSNKFETIETQMAELKYDPQPEIEISKKDSVEFLGFWERFYKSYKENDTSSLIKLSLDSVRSPVNIEDYKKTEIQTELLSISGFINAPFRKKYLIEVVPFTPAYPFIINYRYVYNPDSFSFKLRKDSALLTYYVAADSKEIRGNYEIHRIYSFSFIRKSNKIRFTGLEIGDRNSEFLNDSTTRANFYFPLYKKMQDSITNFNALDTFTNLWYSNTLSEFKEPNVYRYSGKDDIYRFCWLRSFNNPVVIKLQKHEDEYILTTKEMINNGGYIPNEFVVNSNRSLSVLTWNDWEIKLGRIGFWNRPAFDPASRPMDGADWILEAKINGKYHFVTRYSNDIFFRECCKYLLRLSNLKIREEDIY